VILLRKSNKIEPFYGVNRRFK